MIHVDPQPEPDDFDARVRQPGLAAIRNGDRPLPDLWRHCLDALMERYRHTCAYACFEIHPVSGGRSVEHWAPKSKQPELAYEWSNYRLVCRLMNSRKGVFENVLDPFTIEMGWFQLEFVGLTVIPNPDLASAERAAVQATIDRLALNDEVVSRAREADYVDYRQAEISWSYLRRRNPFVAAELERQGLRRPNDT